MWQSAFIFSIVSVIPHVLNKIQNKNKEKIPALNCNCNYKYGQHNHQKYVFSVAFFHQKYEQPLTSRQQQQSEQHGTTVCIKKKDLF